MERTNEEVMMQEGGEHVEVRPGRLLHVWRLNGDASGADRRPVMLFVHGAGGRKEQWQAQIDHFKETHDILAFDMVGHGQNDKSGTAVDWYGYGTAHLLHDLLAVVRRFVDPRRDDNVLVAHSYGTVISLKLLAHLHSTPEVQEAREADDTAQKEEEDDGPVLYFSKVVLVGAAGERPAGTAHPIWYLPSFVLEWIRPALGKGFVDKAWHPSTDRDLVLREAGIAATNPMHIMRPLFRGMEWTLEDDAPLITGGRFLFISGANDGITPAESAQTLARWLEENNTVSVEVVDRAAHLPHMEVPHVVNALIQDFVRSTTE
jgi:abhydrolase domain-containing protein 8